MTHALSPQTKRILPQDNRFSFLHRNPIIWKKNHHSSIMKQVFGFIFFILSVTYAGAQAGTLVVRKNANGDVLVEPYSLDRNVFVGSGAGMQSIGNYNTAIGDSAMHSNTIGTYNVAYGINALSSNTTGGENMAIGIYSLIHNTVGNSNTAIGGSALLSNVGGSGATAIGINAMRYVNNSPTPFINYNVAIGFQSLRGSGFPATNTGNFNTAVGYHTLLNNSTGSWNTAHGSLVLASNTMGNHNTATGVNALLENTNGNANTAYGYNALMSNVTGNNLTAIGYEAMRYMRNTSGFDQSENVAVGYEALRGSTNPDDNSGESNTAVGYQTLKNNESGFKNTAIGAGALLANTNGDRNTAIGSQALNSNTTGTYNTAVGSIALEDNTTGNDNIAVGFQTLLHNTVGYFNTAVGSHSLLHNIGGSKITAIGHGAMYYANNDAEDFDNYNVAVGFEALQGSIYPFANTGINNTAIGSLSLTNNTAGSNNSAIGFDAGGNNTIGSNCTFLGYSAESSSGTYSNATAIGNQATVGGTNEVRIGNSSIIEIGGFEPWTHLSDGRFKKNIAENVPGLNFIMQLRPLTYNMEVNKLAAHLKEDLFRDSTGTEYLVACDAFTQQSRNEKEHILYSGFIAQEVEAAALSVDYDFSGVNKPANEDDLYGLSYGEFVVPLVKAVQEQQGKIELQQKMIVTLTEQNAALRAYNDQRLNEQQAQIDSLESIIQDLKAALITLVHSND